MPQDIDPFAIFRRALFIGVAIYTLVTMTGTVLRTIWLLMGVDPHKKLIRAYLSYMLVTLRLKPVLGELVEIGFWSVFLLTLYWAHQQLV